MNEDGALSPPPSKRRRLEAEVDGTTDRPLPPPSTSAAPPNVATEEPLRLFSWNINGISNFLQPSITNYIRRGPAGSSNSQNQSTDKSKQILTTSLRNFLQRHAWPQIVHLQEVKINPDDESTKRKVQHAVNRCRSGPDDGPHYRVHFCLPRDKYNATGFGKKVYGVATVIREDFMLNQVVSVREPEWDVEGRVLVVETRSRLSIWNLYGVNGTSNPYRDPVSGELSGTRHDRKLAFHKAMYDECRQLQDDGYGLIMAGDLNIARDHIDAYPKLREKPDQHVINRRDFVEKFYDDLGLVDTFRSLYLQKRAYTWLPRNKEWRSSCDRIDLILVSRSLVNNGQNGCGLIDADVLMTELDRGPSDHVPVSATLNIPDASTAPEDALFSATY